MAESSAAGIGVGTGFKLGLGVGLGYATAELVVGTLLAGAALGGLYLLSSPKGARPASCQGPGCAPPPRVSAYRRGATQR